MPPDQFIAAQMHMASMYTNAWVAPAPAYGSFLRRLGALLIDSVLAFVVLFIGILVVGLAGGENGFDRLDQLDTFGAGPATVMNLVFAAITIGFTALGGTPGKRMVGLRITNREGGVPGPALAAIRSWPWIAVALCNLGFWIASRGTEGADATLLESVSTIAQIVWFFGCFVVLGTRYKQALHDKLAGTYVIRT
jgi:uncharacterized RDD family membrane protein YckC